MIVYKYTDILIWLPFEAKPVSVLHKPFLENQNRVRAIKNTVVQARPGSVAAIVMLLSRYTAGYCFLPCNFITGEPAIKKLGSDIV